MKAKPPLPGYVKCQVEQLRYGPIIVKFDDYPDLELFFQTDTDIASFANNCGLISTDSPLSQEFVDADLEDITQCPDEYIEVATKMKPIHTKDVSPDSKK